MRVWTRALGLALLVAVPLSPEVDAATRPQDPPIAFVDVNVVPMDRETVLELQTVIVDGDRIVEVGPADEVTVPPNAIVVDGTGRFLMPGLADMHVHLNDIAQALIYVAYGITTVLNMRGDPRHLDWKRQISTGRLVGPHLYTAGRYVNEPRFVTDDQVRLEVERQAAAGYDIIKPHGELSSRAYTALNTAAREQGLPVMGHAPHGLGLQAALSEKQSLAHGEEFIYSWFGAGDTKWAVFFRWLTVAGIVALIVTALLPARSPLSRRLRRPALLLLPVYLLFLPGLGVVLPDTPINIRIGSPPVLWFISLLGTAGVILAFVNLRRAFLYRQERGDVRLTVLTGLALAATILYWVPVAWRGSPGGLERIAAEAREAGIYVTPNLVGYEAIGRQVGPDYDDLLGRQEMTYLSPAIREAWSAERNHYREQHGESLAPSRNLVFLQRLTAALQRAGVPLLAGSDAMNPGAIPGLSLHLEIWLLIESGLSPYEALRTATVNASEFLEADFGTVAAGRRADLVLLIGNPLEDPGYLNGRLGVMVSGHWYPVGELAASLDRLVDLYEREDWFIKTIEEKGLDAALAFVDDEGRGRDGHPAFRETRLNDYGRELMEAGKTADAIRIFDLNARAYPESANVYDSLAEAFLRQEDIVEAIRNYEVSLSLNPANENAAAKLESLASP